MIRCRQCDTLIEDGRPICPNCGHDQRTHAPDESRGASILKGILGFLLAFISPALFGIGYIFAIVVYFVIRRDHPSFAKGMLIGILTLALIILGLLATCIVIIIAMQKK